MDKPGYKSHCQLAGQTSGMILCLAFLFSSCATMEPPRLQPQINSLVVANRLHLAADKISAEEAHYGQGNYLLYYLDRGLVEQMAGRYADSIKSFEKAKRRFAELYTTSISKEAVSWLANDYSFPYRGADYEYVLLNIFQAINFVRMGDINEALVEARDLDSKFQVIEELTRKAGRRHFEDNGFARLFMGILYRAAGTDSNLNDAWIAYRQSLALYDGYYNGKYVPAILKEDLLSLAEYFNDPQLPGLRRRFSIGEVVSVAERARKCEVVLIESVGYSPLKVPEVIPVPLDRGLVTKLVFPRFASRFYDQHSSRLVYSDLRSRGSVGTEPGADIEDIASRDLESRKGWIFSKALLRPALKYLVERKQKEDIEKHLGRGAAEVFGFLSSLYNLYSEQADLRSWQTLPAQIRVARVFLDPGTYSFKVEELGAAGEQLGAVNITDLELKPGKVYFIIRRADR